MLPQDVTEKVLTERLSALGGTILRGVEASSAGQDSGGAYVTVTAGDRVSSVKARYVVAADGMHSVVRAAAKMDFDGAPYPESFVLADVRMDWPFGAAEVSLLLSPDGMIVVAPLPNGIHRIVAMLNNPPVQPSPPTFKPCSKREARRRSRPEFTTCSGVRASASTIVWRNPTGEVDSS